MNLTSGLMASTNERMTSVLQLYYRYADTSKDMYTLCLEHSL